MEHKQNNIKPLVIKYMPRSLDEVVGREEIVRSLKDKIKKGNLGHCLFEGNAGTGKTLIATLLVREVQGKSYSSLSHLMIDASSENGVASIRNDVVGYMKANISIPDGWKFIVMDEADNLTTPSQVTLRRPIEKYMNTCRMIFTCNYADKIIQPLHSRCAVYTFGAIREDAINGHLEKIIKLEDIAIEGDKKDLMSQIYRYGKGEIRFILNNFMEEARSKGVLDQSVIDMYSNSSLSYAKELFCGNPDAALELAIRNPKGSISGAIEYIYDPNNLRSLSLDSKVKIAGWFTDALSDIISGFPYYIAIKHVTNRVKSAISKKAK